MTLGRLMAALPLWRRNAVVRLVLTLALVGIAYGLRAGSDDVLPAGYPFLTFFPAVIISSFVFGWREGLLAGVLGGLWRAFSMSTRRSACRWLAAPAWRWGSTPLSY